jgi:hypothetical protein
MTESHRFERARGRRLNRGMSAQSVCTEPIGLFMGARVAPSRVGLSRSRGIESDAGLSRSVAGWLI